MNFEKVDWFLAWLRGFKLRIQYVNSVYATQHAWYLGQVSKSLSGSISHLKIGLLGVVFQMYLFLECLIHDTHDYLWILEEEGETRVYKSHVRHTLCMWLITGLVNETFPACHMPPTEYVYWLSIYLLFIN